MDKRFGLAAIVVAIALAVQVLLLAGCPTEPGGDDDGSYTSTPEAQRAMVSLSGGTIIGTEMGGAFISGRTVTLSAFSMAKNETTYSLWKEVYDWAVSTNRGAGRYTFSAAGWEGHEEAGTAPGTGTTNKRHGWTAAQKASRPVTRISWRDAIVWCNAYSEKSGLTPAYYLEGTTDYSDTGKVLRVSTDAGSVATAADTVVVNPTATGYRLPTEAEWEYAARGGNQGNVTHWGYTYAGTTSELGSYAWYDVNSYSSGDTNTNYGAHPVGTKGANLAGLNDMSGNVWEWCYDWYDSISSSTVTNPAGPGAGSYRVVRGGGWLHDASSCAVSYRYAYAPRNVYYYLGFRLVRP
ncbi:hypothetical protein AGMMS50293_20640 [Spirochaetia bacterium]|nr:hypothetical protein AGMMS50293_20640 [Spirochaetia bacterium]